MPYIFSTMLYPRNKGMEVAKMFFEAAKKYPDDGSLGKTLVPGALRSTYQGLESVAVIKVNKGKLDESLQRLGSFMPMFNDIEGFQSKVEVYSTISEVFKSFGLDRM
jgi:hypothetical protein